MRGSQPARPYLSARGMQALRTRMSERDLAVVRQVAELRLMSARQIQAVHFPTSEHDNDAAATRARQRVVARLIRDRLLVSLSRRIGGVRAGSAGLVLALGPVGQRALRLSGTRRRAHEPTWRFVDHTLAVSQLLVDVIVAARSAQLDLLDYASEPRSWRSFAVYGARQQVRPDAYLVLGVAEFELRWFVEVDRSSESLPVIQRKCQAYADYYQSGQEQARSGGVFPRVCWVTPDEERATRLRQVIAGDDRLPDRLFVVATSVNSTDALSEVPR
jgi:hypothetical protein